jgi:hypothetical protein
MAQLLVGVTFQDGRQVRLRRFTVPKIRAMAPAGRNLA